MFDGMAVSEPELHQQPLSGDDDGRSSIRASSPPSVESIIRSIIAPPSEEAAVAQAVEESPADAFLASASLAIAQMANRRLLMLQSQQRPTMEEQRQQVQHHHHHRTLRQSIITTMMQRLGSMHWISGERYELFRLLEQTSHSS
jgi:hypothetical protein